MPDSIKSQHPKLLDQVRQVLRLHHYSIHTERSCIGSDFGDAHKNKWTSQEAFAILTSCLDKPVSMLPVPDPTLETKAFCLAGARACPPEDCGGLWGYEELLKVIRDPEDEEHESMMEWLGGSFDPDVFDRDKVNQYLRKLNWPRMTIPRLARILTQRDDVR